MYKTKCSTESNTRITCIKRLVNAAKITRIRFHDLRHTHASILISEDIGIVKVAHRLGHGNPKNTLETYAHLIPNQDNEVADIFHFALTRSVSKCKNESKKPLSETANKHYYINVYWLGFIIFRVKCINPQ